MNNTLFEERFWGPANEGATVISNILKDQGSFVTNLKNTLKKKIKADETYAKEIQKCVASSKKDHHHLGTYLYYNILHKLFDEEYKLRASAVPAFSEILALLDQYELAHSNFIKGNDMKAISAASSEAGNLNTLRPVLKKLRELHKSSIKLVETSIVQGPKTAAYSKRHIQNLEKEIEKTVLKYEKSRKAYIAKMRQILINFKKLVGTLMSCLYSLIKSWNHTAFNFSFISEQCHNQLNSVVESTTVEEALEKFAESVSTGSDLPQQILFNDVIDKTSHLDIPHTTAQHSKGSLKSTNALKRDKASPSLEKTFSELPTYGSVSLRKKQRSVPKSKTVEIAPPPIENSAAQTYFSVESSDPVAVDPSKSLRKSSFDQDSHSSSESSVSYANKRFSIVIKPKIMDTKHHESPLQNFAKELKLPFPAKSRSLRDLNTTNSPSIPIPNLISEHSLSANQSSPVFPISSPGSEETEGIKTGQGLFLQVSSPFFSDTSSQKDFLSSQLIKENIPEILFSCLIAEEVELSASFGHHNICLSGSLVLSFSNEIAKELISSPFFANLQFSLLHANGYIYEFISPITPKIILPKFVPGSQKTDFDIESYEIREVIQNDILKNPNESNYFCNLFKYRVSGFAAEHAPFTISLTHQRLSPTTINIAATLACNPIEKWSMFYQNDSLTFENVVVYMALDRLSIESKLDLITATPPPTTWNPQSKRLIWTIPSISCPIGKDEAPRIQMFHASFDCHPNVDLENKDKKLGIAINFYLPSALITNTHLDIPQPSPYKINFLKKQISSTIYYEEF